MSPLDDRTGSALVGEVIGNFELVGRLGKGATGDVWLAEHTRIKTKVAIKLLRPELSTDHERIQRLFNEAIAVSKIKHVGITRIFDVGFTPRGEAYLVMELLEGESLADRVVRTGPLALAEVADIGMQIASVLDATHVAGITHRDLKPDNIFVVPDGELASGQRVKVLDFGIAKLGAEQAGGLTATDGSMGTPMYMAPEQWRSAAAVDGRADAYSFGCLVFEIACGRPPFLARSIGDACSQHLHDPPPAASALVPELPAALDELLACLLSKDPALRPSMREAGRVLAVLGDKVVEDDVTEHLALGARRWRTVAIAGLALLVGAAAGALVRSGGASAAATEAVDALAMTAPCSTPVTSQTISPPAIAASPTSMETHGDGPPPTRAHDDKVAALAVGAARHTPAPPVPVTPRPVQPPPVPAPVAEPAPEPPPAAASTPSTDIPAALDRTMIANAIARVKPLLAACGTGFPGANVLIHVAVEPNGSVGTVKVSKSPEDWLTWCVTQRVMATEFPITGTGGRFAFPIAFAP